MCGRIFCRSFDISRLFLLFHLRPLPLVPGIFYHRVQVQLRARTACRTCSMSSTAWYDVDDRAMPGRVCQGVSVVICDRTEQFRRCSLRILIVHSRMSGLTLATECVSPGLGDNIQRNTNSPVVHDAFPTHVVGLVTDLSLTLWERESWQQRISEDRIVFP